MAREPSESERESCAEFGRLVEEEKQATADHQLALTLSGLTTNDPNFLLGSTYARNLSNDRSLGADAQWARAKELYAEIHAYEVAPGAPADLSVSSEADKEAYYNTEPITQANLTLCEACL